MPNHFTERFRNKTDKELSKIVDTPKNYVPEAIEAAIEELDARKAGTSKYIDPNVIREERKRQYELNYSGKKPRSKSSFRFIKSFFRLLYRPNTHRIRTSIKNRLLITLRFYLLSLILILISSIPMMFLEELGWITNPEQFDAIPDFIDNSSDILLASILIPIIAGVIEEAQFRLVLTNFNKRYFDIFISLFASYIVTRLFGRYIYINTEFYSSLLIQYTFTYLIFAIPIYFSLSRTNVHSSWFQNNWRRSFRYLFYGLAIIFAMGHLPTIDLTLQHLIFFPLVILPFLIYALTLSYVRIRIGFQYAVLLHFTIDLIAIMIRN